MHLPWRAPKCCRVDARCLPCRTGRVLSIPALRMVSRQREQGVVSDSDLTPVERVQKDRIDS